jgi:glucose/arabinose dehydrogenase
MPGEMPDIRLILQTLNQEHHLKNRLLSLIAMCGLLMLPGAPVTRASDDSQDALPAGYVDEGVTNVSGLVTGLALTPDGRLLISTQEGQIWVRKNGALLPTPVLDLAAADLVCSAFERGIESVAVDPDFATNNRIYVYYTYNGADGACTSSSDEINRVARYTMNGDVAQSPMIILNNIDSPCGNHNGGSLNFGADGYLYVSTGDAGCDSRTARNRNLLNGKILRITTAGGIPADNPYVNTAGSLVCNTSPANPSGGFCQEIFAYGLRNPFKLAFRHGTNEFYINDVGQDAWEEISVGARGADYGWNVREGFCVAGSTSSCGAPPAGMTNPIYAYGHVNGLCSITGGAFSTGVWTGVYADAYYFADVCSSSIFRLVPGAGGSYTRSTFHTPPSSGGMVALLFDPVARALYYGNRNGVVRRIRYTGAANRAPAAAAASDVYYGATPLAVQFSSAGSSDPDGDALTYGWNFGDSSAGSSEPNPLHTYSSSGPFTATLVVTDSNGAPSAPASVVIYAGDTPPTPVITAPDGLLRFAVGQSVTLVGNATDEQDGALPGSALSWRVLLWHVPSTPGGTPHTHPFLSAVGLTATIPSMPAPEDLGAAPLSHLEVQLTAIDARGLTSTVTTTLRPNLIPVTLATEPDGLKVIAQGVVLTAVTTITAWEGMTLTLTAPGIQSTAANAWYKPVAWSTGGAATHDVRVPGTPVTYTAAYSEFVPLQVWLTLVQR